MHHVLKIKEALDAGDLKQVRQARKVAHAALHIDASKLETPKTAAVVKTAKQASLPVSKLSLASRRMRV